MLKLNHYYLGYDIHEQPLIIKITKDLNHRNDYTYESIWGSETGTCTFKLGSPFSKRLTHLELPTHSLEACMELYPELFI